MSKPDTLVTCLKCGKAKLVSFGECLRGGWPVCHGQTMMMESTEVDVGAEVGRIFVGGRRTAGNTRSGKLAGELKALLTNGWTEREKEDWNEYFEDEIKSYYPAVYAFFKGAEPRPAASVQQI